MRQLVELQEHAKEFEAVNTGVIFVFREEREGVAALKKMRDKYKTTFTLTLDYEKKSTMGYSPANRTFDNYIVDADGVVRAVIDGTLRTRAKADALLKTLKSLEEKRKAK